MPIIYLSPSTQQFNEYINTGTEEEWMNRLADEMEPMLLASGIQFNRNTPDMTAASSIRASNEGNYDLHLALHSNAAGEHNEGKYRGILAFYFPGSPDGLRAAELFVEDLKPIYPLPDQVRAEPTTTIGEVRRVHAPSVLLELGFHDNEKDADWIIKNITPMAEALVLALTEYFGIPFFASSNPRVGQVKIPFGALSVHTKPSFDAPMVAKLYNGATVTVLNQYDGWDLISFGDSVGYVASGYITEE